jgi:pimeloyl-ACP methyl ester carboxylesterase
VNPGWRTRLELALGRAELEVLERSLAASAGLRRRTIKAGPDELAVFIRAGDPSLAPLVMVHGFGGDKETWLLTAPLLRRKRGIVAIDLPGHGRSSDVDDADIATPRRHATAVLGVLDALAIPRAIIVGNSLGGGIALRIAADTPDRVAAMVLIASTGPWSHATDEARSWAESDNPLIPGASDAAMRAFMERVTEKPPAVPKAVIRYVTARRSARSERLRRLFGHFIQARGAEAIPSELAAIRAPTLVIHGERDRVIDVSSAHKLARGLPASTLYVLPGIGHVPQLEAPGRVARIIDRYLTLRAPGGG